MFQLKEQTRWWKNSTRKSQTTEENFHQDNTDPYPVEQTSDCMNCRLETSTTKLRDRQDDILTAWRLKRQNATRTYRTISWSILLLTTLAVTSLLPNYVISAPLDFNFVVAESESTESRGSIHERGMNSYRREDMKLSAKEFLGKFGYVKPADWNNVSPRSFEESDFDWDVMEGEESQDRKESFEGSGSQAQEAKELPVITWSIDGISEADYQRALLKYQKINGLNETGELDIDTTSYMGRPRCGVPDRTAVLKANKTDEFMRLTIRTTMSTTTSTEPTTATTGSWMNATTGLWTTSYFTDIMDTVVSATNTTSTTVLPPVIHSITTPTPESSGNGVELDGSGSDPDQEIFRRKRSELTESEVEVEFDDEVTFAPENEEFDYGEVRLRQLGFKDIEGGPISEAELPEETRVSDLEGILEALRQEKFSKMNATKRNEIFNDVVSEIRPPPAPPVPILVRRMVMETRTNRKKRSTVYMKRQNGWRMAFPKPIITWRLVEEWPTQRSFMISNEIWFTVKLAFRMWSEILPRHFREDNTSPMTNVDILLGFGKKRHNRCLVPFYQGNFTQEYAHAWPLPQAEVHFNDDQPFVAVSWKPSRDVAMSMTMYGQPISLLKVALHEIGHTIGLPHNNDRSSVMSPVYTPYQSNSVELQAVDRRNIQQVYGSCDNTFDAVFDWVRQYTASDGSVRWKYNTYFFKKTWFWLYENRAQRPKYGDPKFSSDLWRGVFKGPYINVNGDPHRKIDGVVHITDWNIPNGPIYFFSGDTYTEYDSAMDRTKTKDSKGNLYPRKISDGFPGIPSPIDAVFYKMTERRLYFFKDYLVYKYDWRTEKVESIQYIHKAFPGWGGASPLPSNIDAAYYSYTDSANYFFKGIYFWKLADGRERHYNKGIPIPENSVGPKRRISSKWHYVCDVDLTEMQMSLPQQKT